MTLNDVTMIFAFAPVVGLLLGLSSITVLWATLLLSVVLYIVVPLLAVNVVNRAVGWYEAHPGVSSYAECCPAEALQTDQARS